MTNGDDPRDDTKDNAILSDLREGRSLREVASRHHVSKSAVVAIKRGAGLTRNPEDPDDTSPTVPPEAAGREGGGECDPVGRALMRGRLRALGKAPEERDRLLAEELLAVVGSAAIEELEPEVAELEARAGIGHEAEEARELAEQLVKDANAAEARLLRAQQGLGHLQQALASLKHEQAHLLQTVAPLRSWWAWASSAAGQGWMASWMAAATDAEQRGLAARGAIDEAARRETAILRRVGSLEEAASASEARLARATAALVSAGLAAEHLAALQSARWTIAEAAEVATLLRERGIGPEDVRAQLGIIGDAEELT